MPDIYNLSAITNSPDISTLATGMNSILNGYYYGYFILISVALVVFVYLKSKGYYTRACFVASSWMATILCLFLRPIGLIDNGTMWVCVLSTCLITFIIALMDES